MYLNYNISNGSYYNIDQEITPLKLANGTFWALTFGFNELLSHLISFMTTLEVNYKNILRLVCF